MNELKLHHFLIISTEKKETPKIVKKHEAIETIEMSSAVFTVVATGKPKPHVTWLVNVVNFI